MATWNKDATAAWAAGMRSEKTNALNSTQQVTLKQQVDKWADTVGASETSKVFATGVKDNVKLGVKAVAKSAQVTGVTFRNL